MPEEGLELKFGGPVRVRVPETRPRRGKCILCHLSVVAATYPGSGHVVGVWASLLHLWRSTPIFTGPTIGTDRNLRARSSPPCGLGASEMQLARF